MHPYKPEPHILTTCLLQQTERTIMYRHRSRAALVDVNLTMLGCCSLLAVHTCIYCSSKAHRVNHIDCRTQQPDSRMASQGEVGDAAANSCRQWKAIGMHACQPNRCVYTGTSMHQAMPAANVPRGADSNSLCTPRPS